MKGKQLCKHKLTLESKDKKKTETSQDLENYLKENNLDPAKDWSKDKTHGKAVKELMAKLNKERE